MAPTQTAAPVAAPAPAPVVATKKPSDGTSRDYKYTQEISQMVRHCYYVHTTLGINDGMLADVRLWRDPRPKSRDCQPRRGYRAQSAHRTRE